jgi:dimethylhistidine N-methyltransferase
MGCDAVVVAAAGPDRSDCGRIGVADCEAPAKGLRSDAQRGRPAADRLPSGSMAEPLVHDLAPSTEEFRAAVLAGLSASPKTLPCKFFYDVTGARLFETICTLDEYYPTRTELSILMRHAVEIAGALGTGVRLVEPGSGSLQKVRFLLDHLVEPAGFVPIDISREQLAEEARQLAQDFPELPVHPVCADYSGPLELPEPGPEVRRTVVFFPGSTIGNFEPGGARRFLGRMAALAGPGGAVLLGVDLKKDVEVLQRAYDDPTGVTAAFDKNLLARINRELDGDFDLTAFAHRARYEARPSRMVMELVSDRDQVVRVGGERFELRAGEAIRTEYSHKPSPDDVVELAAAAGLRVARRWTDERGWFGIFLLEG